MTVGDSIVAAAIVWGCVQLVSLAAAYSSNYRSDLTKRVEELEKKVDW